jgi:hypothetical protein
MMISSTKLMLIISVRYANKRLAMGATGLSDTPISEFGLFQNQVYPLMARTFTLNLAFNHAKDLYSESLLQKKEASPFLVCLCCAMKPLISWNARDVATCLVERIGKELIKFLKEAKGIYHAIEFRSYCISRTAVLQLRGTMVYYSRRSQKKS